MAIGLGARLTGTALNRIRSLEARRVAVTGAAGFIGSHLAERLAGSGAIVVRLAASDPELARAIEGCDALVHLAYRPPSVGAGGRLDDQVEANVALTRRLLEAAADAGIAHVSFASSTSVYSTGLSVAESAATRPATGYARLKLEQEAQVGSWSARTGRPVAILRLSTVYGPGEAAHRAIPAFFRSALAGAPPVVDGEGRGPFDPVYVADVADAFLLAVAARASGVFNIGTGVARSPLEVAGRVARVAGFRGPVVRNRHAVDRPRPICNVEKARRELGFEARTPITSGLATEARWLRASG